MNNPMEDKLYAKLFSQVNSEKFQADKDGFRELYYELLKRLESALWIEHLVRTRVLVHDEASLTDRLRGAQLADHLGARTSREVSCADACSVEDDVSDHSIGKVAAEMFFDCYYTGWPFHVAGDSEPSNVLVSTAEADPRPITLGSEEAMSPDGEEIDTPIEEIFYLELPFQDVDSDGNVN